MKIGVGSTNQVKVTAVKELASQYAILSSAQVFSVNVPSGIAEQPKSIAETIQGAKTRAKGAFEGYDLGFGIKSGLMDVPGTKTGMMDVCVAAIYDGKEYHLGLSSAFECPPKIMALVHKKGFDLNQAFLEIGLTTNPKLGGAEGAIGLLTKGRVTRIDYTKQALITALIQLENANLYAV